MKIKVSLFSTTLWRRYLVIISAISVIVSFFFIAIDIKDTDRLRVVISMAAGLVIFYILLWVLANKSTSRQLNIEGSPLEIKVGDVFKEGALRAIGFNEYFDTIVDNSLISEKTLNGLYLNSYVNDIDKLDRAIVADGHLSEMILDNNTNRKIGKKVRYKLGSTHLEGDYLLVAFSRFDKDNRAFLTIKDYTNCLMTFWEEVDRLYAGRAVAIPLMGSGLTRLRDAHISEQELLEILIWTFKVSRVKFRHPARVTIVIHESIKDKINFYDIKS